MAPALPRTRGVVLVLGSAQTLAWASSYYLPAIVAAPMARDLGLPVPTVFTAFSLALLVSAAAGPAAGRAIDRLGGRPVLMATNLLFAAGLTALAAAQGPVSLFSAWALIGLAMAGGLYEGAFATLVRLYGAASRNPITGITLLAGFASTVGWPLSALLESQFGWRGTCLAWAALHLLVGLPLNAWLPRHGEASPAATGDGVAAPAGTGDAAASPAAMGDAAAAPATTGKPMGLPAATGDAAAIQQSSAKQPAPLAAPRRTAVLLAFVFAATWFCSTAMAAHLPRLLQAGGASLAVAVGVAALVGPAQVAGRLLEFGLLRRLHPLLSARLAALAHPLGAAALLIAGAPAATLFALLHGAGNGIMTIAKGTLPLALFGAVGYGARQGWITLPARVLQAAAPPLFGLALDRWGAGALWMTAAIGLTAFVALWGVPRPGR